MKKYSSSFMLLIFLLLFLFNTLENVEASSTTRGGVAGTILFEPPITREAKVGPGDTGIINYTGTLSIQLIGDASDIELINVTFVASTYHFGWRCNITPSRLSVVPESQVEIPFSVTVYVPLGTPFTVSDNVVVMATAEPYPEGEVNITVGEGTAIVAQYHQLSIQCSDPVQVLNTTDLSCILNISNEGNGQDTFAVEVVNIDSLQKDDWVVALSDTRSIVDHEKYGHITISISPPDSISNGLYPIHVRVESEYARTILGMNIEDNHTIIVEINKTASSKHPPPESYPGFLGQSPRRTLAVSITSVSCIAVVSAFIVATEVGKYGFFSTIAPLYTKTRKKKDPKFEYIKGSIRGYILGNPGESYNAIKRLLELPNGTLAYHLRLLEKDGVVKSDRDGLYRRFYPVGVDTSDEQFEFSELQWDIFSHIQTNPGSTQKEVQDRLNISQQKLNYHIKQMINARIIKVKREGNKTRCFVVDDEET